MRTTASNERSRNEHLGPPYARRHEWGTRPDRRPPSRSSRWLSGKVRAGAESGRGRLTWDRIEDRFGAPRSLYQAIAGLIQWLWSFIRLGVAATSRHSDSAAPRPRRWNRLILRLNLICPN